MSCIYGLLKLNEETVSESILAIMQKPLNHWREDTKGIWLKNNIGLGHLMRFNTPESVLEKLPFYNSISELCITADARLDNRNDLFALLSIPYTERTTITDSSLIVKTYEKFGQDCVKHIVGDFAFAIWNDKKKQLFCARDQMGVKPFFYYTDNNQFAFASEIKGLLALEGIDKSINELYLYCQIISDLNQPENATPFAKIHSLPPAHSLSINYQGNIQINKYWHIDATQTIEHKNKSDYEEGFCHQLEQAVQCRLRSYGQVATELSGGMDSSGITGIAANYLRKENKELITISNTVPRHFEDDEIKYPNSERKYINAVIDFNHINQSLITNSDSWDGIEKVVDFFLKAHDGINNWQQVWQLPLWQTAQENNIYTLISGFPGDELVTYRGKYSFLDYLDNGQLLKYIFAKKKYSGFNKLEPFIPFNIRYQIHRMKLKIKWHNSSFKKAAALYNIPHEAIAAIGGFNWLHESRKEEFNSYRHFQKTRFLRLNIPTRMEAETRAGLYFGVETRFPMADIRLAQYYISLPNYLKYEGPLERTLYRNSIKKYLPNEVMLRNDKSGSMMAYSYTGENEEKYEQYKLTNKKWLNNIGSNKYLKYPNTPKDAHFKVFVIRWLEQNMHQQH